MLDRITKECSKFLSDWQAGFRPLRGCRDNVLLLRVLIDTVLKRNANVCVTFIDYSAAFESVGHKYLDRSLAAAGASRKTRAMFRAIYAAAEGVAKVQGLHGKTIYSKEFKVRRGVIQGDIISPIFFVLAMEQIFRHHDNTGDNVAVGNHLRIGVLGYADDAAIISSSSDTMSDRVSSISHGSRSDADMNINITKTKNLHVARQEKVTAPTLEEMQATEQTFKHECKFFPRKFKTKRGLHIHQASCNCQHGLAEEEDEFGDIDTAFGTVEQRWYRVQWSQHPGKDTWEPERSLRRQGLGEAIRNFWVKSNLDPSTEFIADPDDVWRCYCCGKGFKLVRTLKAHITRTHPKRKWLGSAADKHTRHEKRVAVQKKKAIILCEGKPLKNVWSFVYLGSRFSADGDPLTDVKARIASAMKTAGKMRNIWSSKWIPLPLKLRIYITSVCSQLTYGSEAWKLDAPTIRKLNGVNSRILHHITGKTIREEASADTRSFDIV